MTRNKLFSIKKKQSGRDASGHVSTRHRGGEHKRFLRLIDWQRAKKDIKAKVLSIEYDPNRTAKIALLAYTDGTKKYILATSLLKLGDTVVYSDTAPIKDGNKLSLKNIPVGTPFHCLEYRPGSQAQLIKSAGSAAYLQSVE